MSGRQPSFTLFVTTPWARYIPLKRCSSFLFHCRKPGIFFNIPVFWLTEITQFRYQQYFIDEQRKGPYSLWHHEHHFTATEGGVLMTDIVYYALPAGFLGRIAHALWVKKQLAAIFDYRYQKIARHWPGKLTDDSSLAVDRWPKRDNG